jgi:Ca-activated chloride channel family protein
VNVAGDGSAVAAPKEALAESPETARPVRSATNEEPRAAEATTWVGASAESDVVLAQGGESVMGVWVDVPTALRTTVRAPVDLALVIDTSGSMQGAKIQAARASARSIIERLQDGDILSIDAFDDAARVLLPPTPLSAATRERALSTIAELRADGSTNMAAGLQLGESHLSGAPADHPVRRLVLVSDGQANVGLSSPAALGNIAAASLRFGGQVTSLGVGIDYDEATLDAIAERTSGRLFHVGDPKEMQATIDHEIDLLASTVASDAVLEVVPAPGVKVSGVEGPTATWQGGGVVDIPLGALFPGQHREALIRVELGPSSPGIQRALASVRLRFRDPAAGGVERVQEVLARATTSTDGAAVAAHANAKTHAMMATLEASKAEIQAAQAMNSGNFQQAEVQLAQVEDSIRRQAAATQDVEARERLEKVVRSVAAGRATAAAAPKAAPSAVRGDVLQMNQSGMGLAGY